MSKRGGLFFEFIIYVSLDRYKTYARHVHYTILYFFLIVKVHSVLTSVVVDTRR